MKRYTSLPLLLSLLLATVFGYGQAPAFEKGQIIVQIKPHANIETIVKTLGNTRGINTGLKVLRHISPPMNIWLLEYDSQTLPEGTYLSFIKRHPAIQNAQLNHIIDYRGLPNDPMVSQQWQYVNTGGGGGVPDADIDADSAWNITTGGVTALGDTIVICVIDDGVDTLHPDWGDNLWVNRAEIRGNGLDDDGNGYVDDYLGWNAYNLTDDIKDGAFGGGHGSSVAGIVGAQGDNNIGVTGVNWNVKLMIVVGGGNEAQAIEAYTYPLTLRKKWNATNGTEGAFVVGTNASWGIDFLKAEDAPLWCALYDTLGRYGIMSAGATTNSNTDVDVQGDMPTSCGSDFIISVTNMNNTDTKETWAGYGAETIDLGAHGEGTFTIQAGGGYAGFGGTSGASPHVAGTIGLLYSAPCTEFAQIARDQPDMAAILVKKFILDGTDPNASLAGITVTGGRLNLHKALLELLDGCAQGFCLPPTNIEVSNLTDTDANVYWDALSTALSFNISFREVGGPWSTLSAMESPYEFSGLAPCTHYEVAIQTVCDSNSSSTSDTISFTTDGCCDPPTDLVVDSLTISGASISWSPVLAAVSYTVRISEEGTGSWTEFSGIADTTYQLTELDTCTSYEIQVQTICAVDSTLWTTSMVFTTSGCGSCTDLTYCISIGEVVEDEWIDNVTIGTINNTSGPNDGYGNFTELSTDLYVGSSVNISLTPGYGNQSWSEYFMVWIDWDKNGFFNIPEEIVYNPGSTVNSTTMGTFTVPNGIEEGSTRMRVSMQFQNAPGACITSFEFGEVEDYCVNIIDTTTEDTTGIQEVDLVSGLDIYPNPARESISIYVKDNRIGKLKEVVLLDNLGRDVSGKASQLTVVRPRLYRLDLPELPEGVYFLRVAFAEREVVRKIVIR